MGRRERCIFPPHPTCFARYWNFYRLPLQPWKAFFCIGLLYGGAFSYFRNAKYSQLMPDGSSSEQGRILILFSFPWKSTVIDICSVSQALLQCPASVFGPCLREGGWKVWKALHCTLRTFLYDPTGGESREKRGTNVSHDADPQATVALRGALVTVGCQTVIMASFQSILSTSIPPGSSITVSSSRSHVAHRGEPVPGKLW